MLFLTSDMKEIHVPVNPNAIVSMVIGDSFVKTWVELSQPEWIRYAIRHGLDIILVNRPLDESTRANARSPAWQKLLILQQPWAVMYERIVWLDSDILINPTAPNILDSVPDQTALGIPAAGGDRESAAIHVMNERLRGFLIPPEQWPGIQRLADERLFRDTIRRNIDSSIKMYCTGVMVLNPQIHNDMFIRTYNEYDVESRLYEQPGLSYEICKMGNVTEVSYRFNWMVMVMLMMYFPEVWGVTTTAEKYLELLPMLRKEYGMSYFLHFAGCGSIMQMMNAGDMDPENDVAA